jgi:hypothetical protein
MLDFKFSTYQTFDWIMITAGLIFLVSGLLMFDVYRLTKARPYLLVLGFIACAAVNSFSLIKFNYDSNSDYVVTQYSNRFCWFFMYLVGFSILEGTEKKIRPGIKRIYYAITALSVVIMMISLHVNLETANTQSKEAFFAMHIHQILSILTVIYCIIVMGDPINLKRARRAKYGWLIGMTSMAINYILVFSSILIFDYGSSFMVAIKEMKELRVIFIVLWFIAESAFVLVLIFIPENFLVTPDTIILANQFYKQAEILKNLRSITYNSLRDYLDMAYAILEDSK